MTSKSKQIAADRATARAAAATGETVRLYLRRSVGREGKYYGPGWADVPAAFAKSLIAAGAIQPTPEDSDATTAKGEDEELDERTDHVTKKALREYGDADALRELAKAKSVDVAEDATKAELVDALYDANVTLE